MNTPLLLVIAGPSGSGKSTLCDNLVARYPEFSRVVTVTTRPPRPEEVKGVHYHFFSPEDFHRKFDYGEFLEFSLVHGTSEDRLYGTLKSSVIDELAGGQDLVMSIDVKGVAKLRKMADTYKVLRESMITVFLQVDRETLYARMHKRGDDQDEIMRRMQTAEEEMLESRNFDYVISSTTPYGDLDCLVSIMKTRRQTSDIEI